jgi:hypothetical protein
MLLIDHLKANGAPPPDEALQKQLATTFSSSHTTAKNRLQQKLKDWQRTCKATGTPCAV